MEGDECRARQLCETVERKNPDETLLYNTYDNIYDRRICGLSLNNSPYLVPISDLVQKRPLERGATLPGASVTGTGLTRAISPPRTWGLDDDKKTINARYSDVEQ